MSERRRFRVLIGYDGSECGDAAVADLEWAGLPAQTDITVMTVADVFLPANEGDVSVAPLHPAQLQASIARSRARAAAALETAQSLAARAAERIKASFPDWNVEPASCADSPAWALVKASDSWPADLVVVGARGHGLAGGRLILGSVSQRVLYEARCSVRVARSPEGGRGSRILVGFDGSVDSRCAVRAVASRSWPGGTEARVVTIVEPTLETSDDDETESLIAAGLVVSRTVKEGRPTTVLLAEAESWRADSIFVGTRGIGAVGRLLLGSVSSALAARARCSVEVVRSHAASR